MKTKAEIICRKVSVRPDDIKLNILFAFNEGGGKTSGFMTKRKSDREKE